MKNKIAISSCLAGNTVRYDGRHKRSPWLEQLQELGFELVVICPEVEIGMSVPRPPIELVCEQETIRVKMVSDHEQDFTDKLVKLAEQRLSEIEDCVAYICADKSPSCGFKTTLLYDTKHKLLADNASGAFVEQIAKQLPQLIIINHGELKDPNKFAGFIEAIR